MAMIRIGAAARTLSLVVTLAFLPLGELVAQDGPSEAIKLIRPDITNSGLPRGFPRPVSAWQSAEKAFYETLLSKGRFDVLVVPFQVEGGGFDRATRSLMTAAFALAVGAQGKNVPDPYLVARALGDGYRRLDLGEVYRLAGKLQVGKIVFVYVGHENDNRIRFTIQHHSLPKGSTWPSGTVQTRQLNDLPPFSYENPPLEVYRQALPMLLLNSGFDSPGSARGTVSRFESTDIPASPLGLVSDRTEPARDAYALQLLAALTPGEADRTRERFAEKSFLAVLGMSTDSPDYRVLKARALMQLGHRLPALKALGKADSDEAKHLFAMLNGNLPDVQRYAFRVRPGIPRLIARIELNALASYYGNRTREESIDEAKKLALPGRSWPVLAGRAFASGDRWSVQENSALKALLDRDFTIPTFTAERIIRGSVSLGDSTKLQTAFDLSVLEHTRKYTEMKSADWCCRPLAARVTEWDYLDLLSSLGTSNLVRRADLLVWTQGLPQQTLDFLARIDSVYRDHPQLTVARARAEFGLSREAEGSTRSGLERAAYEHALDAYYWEQGQTVNSAAAVDVISETRRSDYGMFLNPYSIDLPFRPYFPSSYSAVTAEEAIKYAGVALTNSTANFRPVIDLNHYLGELMNDWARVDEILKSIEGRFEGNPQRPLLLARNSARKGDLASAKRYYRESIKSEPRRWEPYGRLGAILLEDTDFSAAAQVFMSYPGFKEGSGENVVNLSNDAYLAGSALYWSGHLDEAMPLYRIAAELETGSDASLSSAIRIDLVSGDYASALSGSLQRAQRYNSAFAYRDYLGMLYAMGRSKEAWDAFNGLVGKLPDPELWETPLVGHRIAGASESEIAEWVKREPIRNTDFAGMYLLRAGVTDRMPGPDLPAAIALVERRVWELPDYYNGKVVRESTNYSTPRVLNVDRESTLPIGVFESEKKKAVKSDLVSFAEAYRLMRTGDTAKARKVLEDALALYDTRLNDLGYLLPYYAFAAAKSGDTQAVLTHLKKYEPRHQRFDYYLSRAILSGFRGNASESLRDLQFALHRRPFTQGRPVYSEYQFAEICEWLYEATKDPRYRDLALSWAKSVQAFSPWFAWPYALEAKLAPKGDDRDRAIAMAFYLDPKSERLRKIAKSEIDAATARFAGRNPFLRTQQPPRKDRST